MIRDSPIYPRDMRIKLNMSAAGDTEEQRMKTEGGAGGEGRHASLPPTHTHKELVHPLRSLNAETSMVATSAALSRRLMNRMDRIPKLNLVLILGVLVHLTAVGPGCLVKHQSTCCCEGIFLCVTNI